jgi:hypothetical protein
VTVCSSLDDGLHELDKVDSLASLHLELLEGLIVTYATIAYHQLKVLVKGVSNLPPYFSTKQRSKHNPGYQSNKADYLFHECHVDLHTVPP